MDVQRQALDSHVSLRALNTGLWGIEAKLEPSISQQRGKGTKQEMRGTVRERKASAVPLILGAQPALGGLPEEGTGTIPPFSLSSCWAG